MRRINTFVIPAGLAVIVAAVLSGCSSSPDGEREKEPAPVSTPIASETPADSSGPTPARSSSPKPRNYFEDDVFLLQEVPIDGGPIPYAEGTAQLNSEGVPISYTVGEGDLFEFVAKRFDLGTAYLWNINVARRDGKELYVGDIINLDPRTITTVGSQNGVEYDHRDRLSDPHLPQNE